MLALNKAAFRYYGGKWHMAKWIIAKFKEHRVYVEPFGGAASVLMQKPRSYSEVYNDLDTTVVTFFRLLRDPIKLEQLKAQLRNTPYARAEWQAAAHSEQEQEQDIELVRKFIVAQTMSFQPRGTEGINSSTGFRSDAKREYSTAAQLWAEYPDYLETIAERFRGVLIESTDAFELIRRWAAEPDFLWYLDPPYMQSLRHRPKQNTYGHELTKTQHEQLVAACLTIRGQCVLSCYDTPAYQPLTDAGWTKELRTHRNNSFKTDKIECLYIK